MMIRTRHASVAAAAAALVPVLLACGGRNGGTTDSAKANTTAAATPNAAGGAGGAMFSHVATIPGFKTPESVKYDADEDVYFVSNINGNPSQKDGNGFISRIRPDSASDSLFTVDSLHFIAGGRNGVTLNAPKGMAIVGDTLAVADIDAVRFFDKHTGKPLGSVELGRMKAHFLNDIDVGPDGALYITDTGVEFDAKGNTSHPGPDQIFKIAGRTPTVAISDSSLAGPNGIAFDGVNGRFVVVPFLGKTPMTWKSGDAKAAPIPSVTTAGQLDGVAVLPDGRILVSSWADSSVASIGGGGGGGAAGSTTRVVTGVPSPADIGLDTKRNRLMVPIFMGDRVEIYKIR